MKREFKEDGKNPGIDLTKLAIEEEVQDRCLTLQLPWPEQPRSSFHLYTTEWKETAEH